MKTCEMYDMYNLSGLCTCFVAKLVFYYVLFYERIHINYFWLGLLLLKCFGNFVKDLKKLYNKMFLYYMFYIIALNYVTDKFIFNYYMIKHLFLTLKTFHSQ